MRAPLAPIGWPERAGAAVDVELVVGDGKIAHGDHGDAGEGFVDFEQVDVGGAASPLEQAPFASRLPGPS